MKQRTRLFTIADERESVDKETMRAARTRVHRAASWTKLVKWAAIRRDHRGHTGKGCGVMADRSDTPPGETCTSGYAVDTCPHPGDGLQLLAGICTSGSRTYPRSGFFTSQSSAMDRTRAWLTVPTHARRAVGESPLTAFACDVQTTRCLRFRNLEHEWAGMSGSQDLFPERADRSDTREAREAVGRHGR